MDLPLELEVLLPPELLLLEFLLKYDGRLLMDGRRIEKRLKI